MNQSTVDPSEVLKFAALAKDWWSPDGPLHTLHEINPVRLDYIESFIDLNGYRVLDIGCGGGLLSEGMALRGAQVTGLDVEPESIEIAKAHAQKMSLDISYLCQPIETFESEPFPIITCLEMLEHVHEPKRILEQARRLLAPGGYLFLSTINRSVKAYAKVILAAEYLLGLLPRETHDYQRFIKPSELDGYLRALDLELLDIRGLDYSPLTRTASLSKDVEANFLMVCRAS